MALGNLETTIMLTSLKKCLGKRFSRFQQKQQQSEITSTNLLNLSTELKSIYLTYQISLDTIVESEATLNNYQTKIYQEIQKILILINRLNETCLQSSFTLKKKGSEINVNDDKIEILPR